ncbi:MAG TPA: ACP S-malonyltransferase, partial [Sporolactobacillaceae bacterium]|nr:ACP S-malonyltransferase [Sporolactobacillaceae bacterium]
MGKIAFLFPGQGSQLVGMVGDICAAYPEADAYFTAADQRLGFSLSKIIKEGPDETLTLTENAQPAILTASMAPLSQLQKAGIQPDYVAGHSLGEYSALVASGALSFEDAVYAVRNRGLFMEEAVPAGEGAMAAILGLDAEPLEKVCQDVTAEGDLVQIANLNSPGQIAISGTKAGVEKASALAKEAGAKRAIPLNVSGPFHSALMKPAAEKLEG